MVIDATVRSPATTCRTVSRFIGAVSRRRRWRKWTENTSPARFNVIYCFRFCGPRNPPLLAPCLGPAATALWKISRKLQDRRNENHLKTVTANTNVWGAERKSFPVLRTVLLERDDDFPGSIWLVYKYANRTGRVSAAVSDGPHRKVHTLLAKRSKE